MWSAKQTALIAILICAGFLSISVPVVAANSPDAREVLRRCTEARKKLTSFILETKAEVTFTYPAQNWRGKQYGKSEYRFDGVRGRISSYMWGNVSMAYPNVSKDQPQYLSRLWDGKTRYAYNRSVTSSKPDRVKMRRVNDPGGVPKSHTLFVQNGLAGLMMGYIRGDSGKRIDEILGRAEDLELRWEKLRRVNCYVIDAVVKGKGRYTLWIDPTHDYHIAKMHILRKSGDSVGGVKIREKNSSRDVIVEVLGFQRIGDSWFPKRYKKTTKVILDGDLGGKSTAFIDITKIVLNPDHDALKSFTPYDIPNGTSVIIMAFLRQKFVWRDGKVVDALGQVILDSGPAPKQPAAPADAKEVLRRFTESRKNLNSFIVKAHVKTTYTYSGFNGIGVSHSNVEFRYDGNRVKNITYHWGDIGRRDRDVKEEDAHYYSNLWDGETAYSFTKSETHNKGIGTLKMSDKDNPGKYSKQAPESFRKTHFGEVMGYHRGDDVRIGELFLRPSTKLQLRGERNNVNGVDCYVVEANVPEYGKYTVWIDPVHDFHIARIRVQRESGDHVYKQILKEKAIQKELYEVLEFEKKGDAWFPKTCKMKKAHNSVEHQSSWEKEFSFSMITLNPDHDALGSFLPDDIPNGCDVRLLSLPPSKKFVWRDGKVVDKDGREVDVDKLIKDESEKVKNPKPKRK